MSDDQDIGTSYTRAQFAAAVDEAHGALHEADALLLGRVVAEGTTDAMRRAHDALHNVGAGQERVACATLDPEAQAIHADLRALRDREIPCGHTVVDLVYGSPDLDGRPAVTQCGACLANRQAWKAAQPRTPEVVLRAMLRAYEAATLEASIAYHGAAPGSQEERAALDVLHPRRRAAGFLRPETAAVAVGFPVTSDWGNASLRADYEARLRGDRPLDASPMEAP